MTSRDKRMIRLLCVLGPVLLLASGYGYSQVQAVKKRKAERKAKAKQRAAQAPQPVSSTQTQNLAAGKGTRALPSPPPGATPADNRASVPPAASYPGVYVATDTAAQNRRMKLPWGRDPFTPPDAQGPEISAPSDMESPRGKKTLELEVHISDRATGNSGVRAAVLYYGEEKPFDEHEAKGKPPVIENGDGAWTFVLPAPHSKPFGCCIVAVDGGRLRNRSRSRVFTITPPPKNTYEAAVGGADVKLTLRGISWADKGSVALINNDVVAEGEHIHGYKVVKIAKDGVTLKRNDTEIFLQLKE